MNIVNDTVIGFLGDDENRMGMAAKIILAEKAIRKKIAQNFIARLNFQLQEVARKLGPEWFVINHLEENPFDRYKPIGLGKRIWKNMCGVALEPQKFDGREFVIGVRYDHKETKREIDPNDIKLLHEDMPGYVRTQAWPLLRWLHDEKIMFSNGPGLEQVVGSAGLKTAQALGEEMYGIALKAEKILDKAVASYLTFQA